MSWKEQVKEWGPASLQFLSSDGSSLSFIVVGDPILLEGTYMKKVQKRMGCPIVTEEGFFLFVGGLRIARKLATLEEKFLTHIITVTRHGGEGDVNTTYDVAASPDKDRVKALWTLAKTVFTKEALDEAIAEAVDIVGK